MPRTARILAAAALAAALGVTLAGTAGAVTMAAPEPAAVLDHAVIVTFEVTGGEQIPTAVEPADLATAYDRMLSLAAQLRLGCGVHQLDEFPPGLPVPVVGKAYPKDTPGALSAIPNIVGNGAACVNTPPDTTSSTVTTEAPTSTPTTAPAAVDETTTAPAPIEVFNPTTTSAGTPAPAVPADASASVAEAASVRTAALPLTGAHSKPVAMFAAALIIVGAGVLLVARQLHGRRI